MYKTFQTRLSRLINLGEPGLFKDSKVGLEKESLRVSPDGTISQRSHPRALGSALTHSYVTTDYSEALLEFITPPLADINEALRFLQDLQLCASTRLEDDELLWATSMPCVLAGETSIPIARYGTSNRGMMKHVYRRGLGLRYGRVMQVIAGVHYNYSLPASFWPVFQDLEQDSRLQQSFVSDAYFWLIRNLQRLGWLIPYLFGASPAVCRSFFGDTEPNLTEFDDGTYFEPYATSLRVSDIGYQNTKEAKVGIRVCYDNLDDYIESLTCAIEAAHPDFEALGVKVDGEYRQLNANLLQIENEYYSSIRPKQIVAPDEKPTLALKQRGVRYVELRSLDVSAFDPLGMNADQLRFLEAFLVFCLLHESPLITPEERHAINHNQSAAALRGRDPALHLVRDGKQIPLRAWAIEIGEAMEGIAAMLDQGNSSNSYSKALAVQMEAVQDPDRTPSARMLAEMSDAEESFFEFAMDMSKQHHSYFMEQEVPKDRARLFADEARKSLERQRAVEQADELSFDEFLARYFAQS